MRIQARTTFTAVLAVPITPKGTPPAFEGAQGNAEFTAGAMASANQLTAEHLIAQGKTVADVCRVLEVTQPTEVGVPEAERAAGSGERPGDIGRAVVAHHPPAVDPLAVGPGDRAAEKADHRWCLRIREHLDVGNLHGLVHLEVDPGVTDAIGAALASIASDPVAHVLEADQVLTSTWIRSPD
jgi:hypothetical protein